MSKKKFEACNGKIVSKKKLKKHFKKIQKEVMSTGAYIGLSKRDLKRIKKGKDVDPPKDVDAFMRTLDEIFPGFSDYI